MKQVIVTTPLLREAAVDLRAGDMVLLSGSILTARDAAHKRLISALDAGLSLPVEVADQIIYYVGPAPARPGTAVGPAGPTTSYRMDPYTPTLLDLGLRGMIGKGHRSEAVIESMKHNQAVYFGAVGGAAALISRAIKRSEVLAYADLGPEAIHRFYVEDMPLIVLIDSLGNSLYETEPGKYRRD